MSEESQHIRWIIYALATSFALSGLAVNALPMVLGGALVTLAGIVLGIHRRSWRALLIVLGLMVGFSVCMALLLVISNEVSGGTYGARNGAIATFTPVHAALVAWLEITLFSKFFQHPKVVPVGKPDDVVRDREQSISLAGLTTNTVTEDTSNTVRKGWQLPVQPGDVSRPDVGRKPSPSGVIPAPQLSGAVYGEVASATSTTIENTQFLTLRLEHNDPHAGRTVVGIVQLDGPDSAGFASVGDWIEAVGRGKPAKMLVHHCVNHTTGAVYDNAGRRRLAMLGVIMKVVFGIVWLAIAAFIVAGIAGIR